MPPRKRLEAERRRAPLLALASTAFSVTSYDEVSMDALARAAKVSKGLLYHYFPSKPAERTLVRGWVGMVEAASVDWVEHRSLTRPALTKLLVKRLLHALQIGAQPPDGGRGRRVLRPASHSR